MRLRRDHHRRALRRRGAGDPLAGPHPRALRHVLDVRPVRRPQDEFVSSLVVEVDEAGVGVERVRDLGRDEVEHLFEIERRVDRRRGLGQKAEVPLGRVHAHIVGGKIRDWGASEEGEWPR